MLHCTFQWEHLTAMNTPVNSPFALRTINAQALYQSIDNNKKVYIKEVTYGNVAWDTSAQSGRPIPGMLGLAESGGTVVASRNLLMTLVNPNDVNTPDDVFLFVSNNSVWYGKIEMPPEFTVGVYGTQFVTFAAGDIYMMWLDIGYDLE